MKNINIKLIAFPGAAQETFDRGKEIINSKLNGLVYTISENNPDAILILTGGSENEVKIILEGKEHILILALTENNSYAAASEIKAYCNQHNIKSILYNIDIESNIKNKIYNYFTCRNAIDNFSGYKIGLIGNVSNWLIASDINRELLKKKLGFQLEQVNWSEFSEFNKFEVNNSFIDHFENSELDLQDTSKVYNLLNEIKSTKQLDAITVECFPLVREHAVTACLALSKFNTDGFPAGCEGDITSIIGKVILKELTGQIPWMANLVSLDDDQVFLAHCTIATNLVDDYTINTHFETDLGTAIQGKFKSKEVNIFRLNNELNKAFISFGEIIQRPEQTDACRTQIKVKLPPEDISKLSENPLGNHHLVIPGDVTELLKCFCKLTQIEII